MNNYIPDMSVGDLRNELIGQKIVDIDTRKNTITTASGKKLHFKDTYQCCAWFEAELSVGNLTDNAITSLDVTDNQPENHFGSGSDYTIHIMAADKNIADVNIYGDETSGYYCHSVILEVTEVQG